MKGFRLITGSLALSAATMISGCGGDAEVHSPTEDSIHPTPPDLDVSFGSIPSNRTIRLNANNITSNFGALQLDATDDRYHALAVGTSIETYLIEGANTLNVTSSAGNKTRNFIYDTTGPQIQIANVADDPLNRNVTGFLYDPAHAQSLTVAGSTVALGAPNSSDRSAFSVAVPLTTTSIDFVAADTLGHQLATRYVTESYSFDPLVRARLEPSAMSDITVIAQDLLTGVDWNQVFTDNGPVLDQDAPPILYELVLSVTDLSFPTPTIDLTVTPLGNGTVEAVVTINNLVANIEGEGWVGNPVTNPYAQWQQGPGTITGTSAQITANMQVTIDGNNEFRTIVNSVETGEIQGLEINLGGLALPASLLDLAGNAINGIVSNVVAGILPNTVDDLLSSIPLDIDLPVAVGFQTDPIDFTISAVPNTLSTPNGGIEVDLGGNINAERASPTSADKATLGSVFYDAPTPAIPTSTPSGSPYEIAAVISTNALNQALLEGYQEGVLELTMEECAGCDGSAVIQQAKQLIDDAISLTSGGIPFFEAGDEVSVRIVAGSPAEAEIVGKASHLARLNLNNIAIEMDLTRAGETSKILYADFNLRADFNMDFDATNHADIQDLFVLPAIADIDPTSALAIGGLPDDVFNAIVFAIAETIAPTVVQPIEAAIQMPSLLDYTINVIDIWPYGTSVGTVTGPSYSHIAVTGDLVPAP